MSHVTSEKWLTVDAREIFLFVYFVLFKQPAAALAKKYFADWELHLYLQPILAIFDY